MWITYKCKGGETLDDIAKIYKIKDTAPYLKLPANKRAADQHRKNVSFEKGTTFTFLDPKEKFYVVDGPKGKVLLTEKEWKKAQADLKAAMEKVAHRVEIRLGMLTMRHDGQRQVNKEFPVVNFFCSTWVGSKGREPTSSRKAAESAVKALQSAVRSNNFKGFEAAVRKAETAVNKYGEEVHAWIDQLLGSGERWVTGLTVTRDVSFVIFSAAAVTVAAPVSVAATVATASGVGAGTSFLSSGANEVGRAIAGENVTLEGSVKTIGKNMLIGALAGGLAGGLGKWIGGSVAPKLAEKIVAAPVAQKAAMKMVMGSVRSPIASAILKRAQDRLTGKLMAELAKKTGGKIAEGTVLVSIKELQSTVALVMARFVVRVGVGGTVTLVRKALLSSGDSGPVVKSVEKKAMTMSGNVDDAKVADAIARDLMGGTVIYDCYNEIFTANQSKIESEIDAELKILLEEKAKKQK